MALRIFISAGEASGEAYGALLIDELKKQLEAAVQQASFFGMGGPRMAAAGLERIVRAEDVAVMGITEVIRHLPRIYREFRKLKQSLRDRHPAVAILIDFPDIHFKLAEELKRLGVPVIFFVSPQLWAWKKHRIKLVQKNVDRMLVIFPFEEPFYRERGVSAEFVGHPMAELPMPSISRKEFAGLNDLDPRKTWIGLLPGSRVKEIRDNLPEMLQAARRLLDPEPGDWHWIPRGTPVRIGPPLFRPPLYDDPPPADPESAPLSLNGPLIHPALGRGVQFVLPLARTLTPENREWVRQLVEAQAGVAQVRLVEDARATLFHARASIVASGTATVEAALIGNPFVVVYRVSPITYAIAKRVVTVPHVAMANLIAGKRLVPELIQNNFTASNIVRELSQLLPDGPPRQSMMKELADLHGMLRAKAPGTPAETGGAIARVAQITLELLGKTHPAGFAEAVSPELAP